MSPARNSAAWCTAVFSSSATTIWATLSFSARVTSSDAAGAASTQAPRSVLVQGAFCAKADNASRKQGIRRTRHNIIQPPSIVRIDNKRCLDYISRHGRAGDSDAGPSRFGARAADPDDASDMIHGIDPPIRKIWTAVPWIGSRPSSFYDKAVSRPVVPPPSGQPPVPRGLYAAPWLARAARLLEASNLRTPARPAAQGVGPCRIKRHEPGPNLTFGGPGAQSPPVRPRSLARPGAPEEPHPTVAARRSRYC